MGFKFFYRVNCQEVREPHIWRLLIWLDKIKNQIGGNCRLQMKKIFCVQVDAELLTNPGLNRKYNMLAFQSCKLLIGTIIFFHFLFNDSLGYKMNT